MSEPKKRMPFFSERDRALVESLRYDSSLKPAFDSIKGCLVWPDERPDNLSPDGYEKLCDLLIARSFIHENRPFSSWKLEPHHFAQVWEDAIADKIQWPGFQRLKLSEEDQAYLDEESADSDAV